MAGGKYTPIFHVGRGLIITTDFEAEGLLLGLRAVNKRNYTSCTYVFKKGKEVK